VNNHRAALEAARGGAELVLAKVRRGRTGTVELRFDGPTMRFSDAAEPG
jgi:replicative DNA helicase